ncbi:hypothetical protein PYW07_016741 [Mythimna separata]|uniref:ER membrane protein complex subunit 1 n=1 Tax=Mythimna separata TaxID=271217 RepID=A0AAD7YK57_MYTSE|nr:hypothetical protein PYW07_016741 [Mythimna separata]
MRLNTKTLINLSVCIYEDQIGKFDWRQTYVGRIKFSQFDTVSTAKKIIVATEENVLAALNLKTGQVVWRHVFESASTGNIQLLAITDKVVTVSGSNPYLVRGWDSATGVLQWEWSLSLENDEQADFSEWWVQNDLLIHMLPVFGSHLEVSMYHLASGQNRGYTSKLPASWTRESTCVLTPPYYTCISGERGSENLISMDVTSQAVQLITRPLSEYVNVETYDGGIGAVDGSSVIPAFTVDDKKIIMIKNNKFEMLTTNVGDALASVALIDMANGPVVLQAWMDDNQGFTMTAHSVATGAELPELRVTDRNLKIPDPEVSSAVCTKSNREQLVCRVLISSGDDSVHLMQQGGRVLWSREEALANVVAVEFVELPVSDLDAAIESEFDQKEGSIWAAFSRRLQTQFTQLQTLVQSIQRGEGLEEDAPSALVRDYFGLHKIIVLVTDVGKIFGMDNLSGAILWQYYEADLDTEGVVVFTRRTARHPPHDAYLTVVGKQEGTGNGLIISLNPITGTLIGERLLKLDVQLLQCTLLHRPDNEKLHALILLDKEENVQVLPRSAAPLVENMFMYVAERNTARVQGYALVFNGQQVEAIRTWLVQLGGSAGAGHRIVVALGKAPGERVHSPGRVLPDRSVLYKYVNPNLVLFLTEGPDPLHKDIVVATCVDAASGAIVAAQSHRRARALPHAVHTEHYLAYLYYNDKHRRTEIATLELYEGKTRWLPAGAAFSSLSSERAPSVERQAFILSGAPTAAATTVTERSLTDKHVLLALSSGAVVEVPWVYLEARRGGAGEDGVVLPAHAPELPLGGDARLNYNRTLARPAHIHAAPAGLESTSLVLTTGLDLFYTRVAPSKTFDLLKDDFDYYLITVVLAGLILATYSTKYFASRKMLKQAWK